MDEIELDGMMVWLPLSPSQVGKPPLIQRLNNIMIVAASVHELLGSRKAHFAETIH